MSDYMARRSLHYAWIIAVVTFVILLVTAGIRATPGVLMLSLEREFGWSRAVISSAVAINIALFGLIGPFAASVMDRWGVRRVILAAARLAGRVGGVDDADAVAVAVDAAVGRPRRHRHRRDVDGAGGDSSPTRWFDERRGLVLGVLSAANATGQLIFLPSLAGLVESRGWRSAALARLWRGRGRVRDRADLHARSSGGSRPAAVRAGSRTPSCRSPARSRRSRRSRWRHERARSGCWPGRSSCAAPARTA